MRELTFRVSEMPDEIHVIGFEEGNRFAVTIKLAAIVSRTVHEASWRKGRKVAPYHGNIITRVGESTWSAYRREG